MREEKNFVTPLHTRTKRDYLGRVTSDDKAACAAVAKKFGQDYWDGERRHGYGGYRYDGRWSVVAAAIIADYGLAPDARILDVGCGKGFLLYEFTRLLPGATVAGIDISAYAIENSKAEIRDRLQVGDAAELPYADNSFDLVISLGALHNLPISRLSKALRELQRVTCKDAYLMVESFRNQVEMVNLLYWQLTCESFYSHDEWVWLFGEYGYQGDYEFIYFE